MNKVVDIVVSKDASSSTISNQFTYDAVNTPVVTSIIPNKLSVKGSETITITGTNFPSIIDSVSLGGKFLSIISSTSSQIVVKTVALPPGLYDLLIQNQNVGYAR